MNKLHELEEKYPNIRLVNTPEEGPSYQIADAFYRANSAQNKIMEGSMKGFYRDTIMEKYLYESFKRRTFKNYSLLKDIILDFSSRKKFPKAGDNELALVIRMGCKRRVGFDENGFTDRSKKECDLYVKNIISHINSLPNAISKIKINTGIHFAHGMMADTNLVKNWTEASFLALDHCVKALESFGFSVEAKTGDSRDADFCFMINSKNCITCGPSGYNIMISELHSGPSLMLQMGNRPINHDGYESVSPKLIVEEDLNEDFFKSKFAGKEVFYQCPKMNFARAKVFFKELSSHKVNSFISDYEKTMS